MKKKNIIILSVIFLIAISVLIVIKLYHKPSVYEELMTMSGDTATNKKIPLLKDLKEEPLTFYFMGSEPSGTREYLDGVEKQAKALNIKLDFKFIESYNNKAYLEQVKYNINSGLPVDAIYYPTDNTYFLSSLAKDGIIMDLSEPFKNYAPNYFQQFSKEDLNMVSIKNKIYAIPSKNPQSNLKCAVVNESLMKKYNISNIKSIQDLELFLKKVKENEPSIIPLKMLSTSLDLFGPANGYGIIDSNTGIVYKWDDPNMKVLAWEQTPEFRSSILKIYDWYKQGFLGEHPFTSEPINDSDIKSGRWACFIVSPDAQIAFNNMLDGNSNIKYKSYVLYPDKFVQRTSPLFSSMVVCSSCKHVERLLMFYEWLNSNQENYDSLMYGIEGKNYNLKDGNVIPINSDKTPYYFWKNPFVNINFDRPMENQTREGIDEYRKIINKYTKYAPLTTFAPDFDLTGDNYYFRRQLNTYFEDRMDTGLFNESDIDTFVNGAKDQSKMYIDRVQKQVEIWKKNK
jgi:putative aldouronate transport system substrate-binding protein